MKKRAFTLIELLVVIAVIGVLAALLMPALNGAGAVAKQSKCASNLGQLYVALNLYSQDHSGLIVYNITNNLTWVDNISPYIQKPQETVGARPLSILACPASRQLAYNGTPADYGKNIYINGNNSTPPNVPYQGVSNVRMTGLAHPSQIMLFGDSNYRDLDLFFWVTTSQPEGFPIDADGITYRHNGCANFLYYDGHVGIVKQGATPTWATSTSAATMLPWSPTASN